MADSVPLGEGARPARGGAPGRQPSRATGGGKRAGAKTLRVQYHLGEKTVERLGVHCSLVHADKSRVVEEVLLGWLTRYGKGRELFGRPEEDPGGPDGAGGTPG